VPGDSRGGRGLRHLGCVAAVLGPSALLSWLTGVVWGFAVALLRGWNTGIVAVLDHPDEYLMDVDRVDGVTSLLSIYTDNILLVPDRYNFVTHNSGHPPLPLLSYAGLDAIGLGGPAWAGVSRRWWGPPRWWRCW
jgi:hypothetical protein